MVIVSDFVDEGSLMGLERLVAPQIHFAKIVVYHWAAQPTQRLDHCQSAERHVILAVATFVGKHNPTLAESPRGADQLGRHVTEGLTGQHHRSQRIRVGCVETRADKDHVWLEALQGRDDNALEGIGIAAGATARRKGDVDGAADGILAAYFRVQTTVLRVVAILVQRNKQTVGIVPKSLLSAVAVVDICRTFNE